MLAACRVMSWAAHCWRSRKQISEAEPGLMAFLDSEWRSIAAAAPGPSDFCTKAARGGTCKRREQR